MAVSHLVFPAIYSTCLALIINLVEETAVGHLPLGMTLDDLCLFLQLDDGNGLVHTSRQLKGLPVYPGVRPSSLNWMIEMALCIFAVN